MNFHDVDLNPERLTVGYYLAWAAALGVIALYFRSGRVVLKHVWGFALAAALLAAHRWLAWLAPVHWMRSLGERQFGCDTPVLFEHVGTGILCVWGAVLATRVVPGFAADARQQHQERPLPRGWQLGLAGLWFAAVWLYGSAGSTPVQAGIAVVLAVLFGAWAVKPAGTWEWASRHRPVCVTVLALGAWLTFSLSFGLQQFALHDTVITQNAREQLTASLGGLVLAMGVWLVWS
jgi:hypothetical protein